MQEKLEEIPSFPTAAKVEAKFGIVDWSMGMTIIETPPNIMNADIFVVRLKYANEKNNTKYAGNGISTKPLLENKI